MHGSTLLAAEEASMSAPVIHTVRAGTRPYPCEVKVGIRLRDVDELEARRHGAKGELLDRHVAEERRPRRQVLEALVEEPLRGRGRSVVQCVPVDVERHGRSLAAMQAARGRLTSLRLGRMKGRLGVGRF